MAEGPAFPEVHLSVLALLQLDGPPRLPVAPPAVVEEVLALGGVVPGDLSVDGTALRLLHASLWLTRLRRPSAKPELPGPRLRALCRMGVSPS
jgi:hypothetical protein